MDLFSSHPLALRLKSRTTATSAGCWEWKGASDPAGYGAVKIEGRKVNAHRAMYEACVGAIPADAVLRHRCNNPRCIRPDHLRVGTRRENLDDAKRAGRDCRPNKLGRETAERILADRRPARDVAAAYQVAISTVYKIRSGRFWPELQRAPG